MTNEVFDPHQQTWRPDDGTWRYERFTAAQRWIASHVPARFHHAETTDPHVGNFTASYGLHQNRQASLLLLGPTGVGKTHQAYGAVNELTTTLYEQAFPVVRAVDWAPTPDYQPALAVTTAADLYARMRPRPGVDSETVFDRHANAELLVLDDLGAAKHSDWVEELNYRLINHRYEHRLATLITSNVPPQQLAEHLGERVASRLSEMCTIVVLKGTDRRTE